MPHVLTPDKIRDCVKLIAPNKPDRFAISIAPMLFEVVGGRWDGLQGYSYGGFDLDAIQKVLWVKLIVEPEPGEKIVICQIYLKGMGDIEVEYHIYARPLIGVDPEKVTDIPDMFIEKKP
jgi:hypothetical protein